MGVTRTVAKNPTVAVQDNSQGGNASWWNLPSGALLPDYVEAGCNLNSSGGETTGTWLNCKGYGFDVRGTVLGVQVTLRHRIQPSSEDCGFGGAYILKAGVYAGNLGGVNSFTESWYDQVWGGPTSDSLGTGVPWTPADVNHADFGVAVKYNGSDPAHVDWIGISVTYSFAAGGMML